MAYIRVIYRKKATNFDYVPSHLLDFQIRRDEITHFYRPSEKRWINVRIDPVRGKGGFYGGPERRDAFTGPKPEEQKAAEENASATDWLETLWEHIER